MQLIEYIADPARKAKLAADIGTSAQYLWQIATGWRGKRAGRLMADAIERCTNRAVTKADLRPDLFGAKPPKRKAA